MMKFYCVRSLPGSYAGPNVGLYANQIAEFFLYFNQYTMMFITIKDVIETVSSRNTWKILNM